MSNKIFTSFINNDNKNIMNKLKALIYIYKKYHKRMQLIYFLNFKKKAALIKSKQYKHKSFVSNKNKVHIRLYNNLKTKRDNLDKLSQKIFLEEAKKYTYFPEINQYDLVFQNYYILNNPSFIDTRSESIYNLKKERSNSKLKSKSYRKIPSPVINDNYYTLNDNPKIKINKKNIFTNKNMNYNSIIKKKISLLNDLEDKERKTDRVTSKIIRYKNTIPNNFKKYFPKTSKNNRTKKIYLNNEIKKNNIQKTNNINYDLTSFYSSPITCDDLNYLINKNISSTEIMNIGKSINNSYYAQSTRNTNLISNRNNLSINNKTILSPNSNNNSHYIFNSGLSTIEIKDDNKKNKIKSKSYKSLPKNEYSLLFKGLKKTSVNPNIFNNKKKSSISKSNYNCLNNNHNYRQLNSIGLIDNSISTNCVDRPSFNDNYTLTGIDNNQQSLIYSKANKNISYTFPSRDINNSIKSENLKRKIYCKKSSKKNIKKKNHKKILNRIVIDRNLDNITINSNISSKNKKMNYQEQFDNFNFIGLNDKNQNNKGELKITLEVNENVNSKRNLHEKVNSISQKSETITIQTMSDSKMMEIANYYLKEEENIDRIKIDDILTTKNNKTKFAIKGK